MANQLIRVNARNSILAGFIVRVYVDHGNYLMIQTHDGEVYQVDGDYGHRVWEQKHQLEAQIEAALASAGGVTPSV
jgi:outer membrane protein assembly factor BamB